MKGKKELILKTAAKLFFRNGITKTSMDDIAAAAKIGKGTIYHYYESKEQLFVDVTEKEVAELRKMLVEAVEKAGGPEEKLRAYVVARCRMIGEIGRMFTLFKEEYLQYYSYIRKVQDKFLRFEQEVLEGNIGEAVKQGLFRPVDIEFTAYTISRSVHAVEYYFGTGGDPELLSKRAEEFADIFINGLRERGS